MYMVSLLSALMNTMHVAEPQAVAGRWRVLTRAHVRALTDPKPQAITGTLTSIVANILLACGAKGTQESVASAVASVVHADLVEIVRLALEFQRASGEEYLSRDFTAFVASPDVEFDPTYMEDAKIEFETQSSAGGSTKMHVLCTTAVGLQAEIRANDDASGRAGLAKEVLLKPKVVLRTVGDRLEKNDVLTGGVAANGEAEKRGDTDEDSARSTLAVAQCQGASCTFR